MSKLYLRLNLALAASIFLLPICEVHADVTAEAASSAEVAFANPVPDAELDTSRGAFLPLNYTNINNINALNATVSNNTVTGGVTGNNFIGGGAFSNSQGLVNVILNSGNNNIIQSATNVNITFNNSNR